MNERKIIKHINFDFEANKQAKYASNTFSCIPYILLTIAAQLWESSIFISIRLFIRDIVVKSKMLIHICNWHVKYSQFLIEMLNKITEFYRYLL